jgi:hypothetical protein
MSSKDQDFNQRINVASTLTLELYRVLMGAFLMVFVPQKCGDHICSINENINRDDTLSRITVAFNSITLFAFLILYAIEVKRESKLITYLEVNKFKALDNESVGEALTQLESSKKDNILSYDVYYQKTGYLCTGIFGVNSILSSIVIYTHYLDSKTVTVYLTNLLFMSLKVLDVYNTVNTKPNIFYSAYLKNKVQFNDVDPDKIIKIESVENPPLEIESESKEPESKVSEETKVSEVKTETELITENTEESKC